MATSLADYNRWRDEYGLSKALLSTARRDADATPAEIRTLDERATYTKRRMDAAIRRMGK